MASIKNMFNEVQYELVKIILLNVFLSTVIVFLGADLVALIFNMPLWYVVILSFVYFIVVLISEVRKITLSEVEKNNPDLQEILRTAKDNQDDDSLMAHALFHDVMGKMRGVSSGTFIDFRTLMTKLAAVFVLSIILVSIAMFNINVAKFDNPLERPMSLLAGMFRETGGPTDGFDPGDASSELFGDPSLANLGNDQLTATINPSLDNPDFNNVDPANPSTDPLADLGGSDAGFTAGGSGYGEGLDDRDLQRSYEYAKRVQDR